MVFRIYQNLKNIYHIIQAYGWRLFYGMPDRVLHIYGVTGTNGKTTTSYVLFGVLSQEYGVEHVGMLTTVVFRVGEKEDINETKMTTLPSRVVYRYLKQMKDAGVTHVVLEMTSHALDQNRLAGVRLDGAIMLNIQREHLDYHVTMDAYALAKQKILDYLGFGKPFVGKGDDERVFRIMEIARERGFDVHGFVHEDAHDVSTSLVGEVNQENVLATILLARAVGISEGAIQRGVESVGHVPGRMEWVDVGGGVRVLIDYAVTPDALDRLYEYVRGVTSGKIFGILGAAGLRDRGKRPAMASSVARYADVLVLTREDPWTESEEQIFQDLEKGLIDSPIAWKRVIDRKEAISSLLSRAESGDVIVVTGKGAERGMGIGNEVIPWNDREVIESIVNSENSSR